MIVLIHGINDSYDRTVGRFAEQLELAGETVIPFRWGPANFWSVKKKHKIAAKELHQKIEEIRNANPGGDQLQIDVIAHSAGCVVTLEAMKLETYFSDVFFINPAMSRFTRWHKVSNKFQRVFCYHNRRDIANLGGGLIPFAHPFGFAGMFGFARSTGRVFNINMPSSMGKWNHGHQYFNEPGRSKLLADIVAWIRLEFQGGA